ncbi:hypothetical protein [Anatilimnocola floriformis]|uniref:hypothetical protein n=1 Tax=Anatilimnocola floriformis TaxID=2948575 RepID=UPI0020C53288|nr:hypothetical protein [Anatilimnocola floriformis]
MSRRSGLWKQTELTLKLVDDPDTHSIEFDRSSMFTNNPEFRSTVINEWKQGAINYLEMRYKLGESTDEPEPAPASPAPVVGSDPAQDGSQAEDVQRSEPVEPSPTFYGADPVPVADLQEANHKAKQLLLATLQRLQRRIVKAIEAGNTDLSEHEAVIRESLPTFNVEETITQLNTLQAEVKAVLPEQRKEVIEKWDTTSIMNQLP